jgi:hypothetical protein
MCNLCGGFDRKPLVQSPRKIRKAANTHITRIPKAVGNFIEKFAKNRQPQQLSRFLLLGTAPFGNSSVIAQVAF